MISDTFFPFSLRTLAEQQNFSRKIKIDGNPLEKVSAEQQSNKLQVQTNNDESPKRSKKRKSFPKKKKKRKRTKQQTTARIAQHRHREVEDFISRREGSNYSTSENNCEKKFQKLSKKSMEGKINDFSETWRISFEASLNENCAENKSFF